MFVSFVTIDAVQSFYGSSIAPHGSILGNKWKHLHVPYMSKIKNMLRLHAM